MTRAQHTFVAALAVAALALAGCADAEPATQVVVQIEADPTVRSRMTALEVEILSPNAGETAWVERFTHRFEVVADGLPMPATIAVVPRANDPERVFQVRATAFESTVEVVRTTVVAGFAGGKTLVLRVRLDDTCIALGTSCEEDGCAGPSCSTCRAGQCAPVGTAVDLPEYGGEGGAPVEGIDDPAIVLPGDGGAPSGAGTECIATYAGGPDPLVEILRVAEDGSATALGSLGPEGLADEADDEEGFQRSPAGQVVFCGGHVFALQPGYTGATQRGRMLHFVAAEDGTLTRAAPISFFNPRALTCVWDDGTHVLVGVGGPDAAEAGATGRPQLDVFAIPMTPAGLDAGPPNVTRLQFGNDTTFNDADGDLGTHLLAHPAANEAWVFGYFNYRETATGNSLGVRGEAARISVSSDGTTANVEPGSDAVLSFNGGVGSPTGFVFEPALYRLFASSYFDPMACNAGMAIWSVDGAIPTNPGPVVRCDANLSNGRSAVFDPSGNRFYQATTDFEGATVRAHDFDSDATAVTLVDTAPAGGGAPTLALLYGGAVLVSVAKEGEVRTFRTAESATQLTEVDPGVTVRPGIRGLTTFPCPAPAD